jgi:hypothetical protein
VKPLKHHKGSARGVVKSHLPGRYELIRMWGWKEGIRRILVRDVGQKNIFLVDNISIVVVCFYL